MVVAGVVYDARPMLTFAVLLAAFLVGSIPTGVLVARSRGVDLRKVGSGNIGATNVGRALGKKWATFVLIVDAGKGALPVLVIGRYLSDPWLPALAGLAAVLGQVFSIFLRAAVARAWPPRSARVWRWRLCPPWPAWGRSWSSSPRSASSPSARSRP